MKACDALAAVGADHHPHGERGAILAGPQRAQIVGDALRQHRHDVVGKVDRVAADQRFAIERGAGPHVMRDVGDGDRQDEAAAIVRIGVRLGMHRVVVILGVGRIDGDERQRAPVLAARRAAAGEAASASRSTAGGKTCGMPWAWIAIRLMARSVLSEPSLSLTRAVGKPKPRARHDFDGDEIAIRGFQARAGRNRELATELLLVDRNEPAAAVRQCAEHAEDALLGAIDQLDDAARCRIWSASSPAASMRSRARSPTPPTSPGRGRREE